VIDGNRPAEIRYQRQGFVRTGRTRPCTDTDPRPESEMTLALR
jgi:hypothetical protein